MSDRAMRTYAAERVLVIGMGSSGRAALELLRRKGARVTAYDRDPLRLEGLGGSTDRGELDDLETLSGPEIPDLDAFDWIVASPGVPLRGHPRLVPEVDLGARHLDGRLIGITGTNGKSTTAVLVREMLAADGLQAAAAGNLGEPLCSLADRPLDWCVAELSSFQLEHARELRPAVACVLNLAPDHLDRHGSLEAYAAAKARLVDLLDPDDGRLVVNRDDAFSRELATKTRAVVLGFSRREPQRNGAYQEGGRIVLARDGAVCLELDLGVLALAARSPLDNALAAIATASAAGASAGAIAAALGSFAGLPHRAELVCTRGDVRYVDDSKATNPAAAATTLLAMDAPVWWLAGGRNKGLDFRPLCAAVARVKSAILFGEAAPELEAVLEGELPVVRVDTLDEALALVADRALPGDVVLLAPACASQDQFASFAARGERFAELARALPC